MSEFIECDSISISYNEMGIANINYVIVGNDPNPIISSNFTAGGVYFDGVILNINTQPIPNTDKSSNGTWYTTSVNLIATGG